MDAFAPTVALCSVNGDPEGTITTVFELMANDSVQVTPLAHPVDLVLIELSVFKAQNGLGCVTV
jgi:hypothetical protein